MFFLIALSFFSCQTTKPQDIQTVEIDDNKFYSQDGKKHVPNLLDYVVWRGDLSFEASPFNEVDAAILTEFAYLDFEGMIGTSFDTVIELQDLYSIFTEKLNSPEGKDVSQILNEKFLDLFYLACNSKRFKHIKACNYEKSLDVATESQFVAYTLLLPDGTALVCFKGTLEEIVGWKENFNMAFKYPIPAQESAAKYLDNVGKQLEMKIRVVGHSKGGNLAVYSASFCDDSVKEKLIEVFSFDGPGFREEFLEDYKYISVLPKIRTFVPENSVIGMIFDMKGAISIIKCTGAPLYNHDLFYWEILGPHFYRIEKRSKMSEYVKETLDTWVVSMTLEQKEAMINSIFDAVKYSGAKTVTEFFTDFSKYYPKVTNYMNSLDKDTRDNVDKAFSLLVKAMTGYNKEKEKEMNEIR